MAIAMQDRIKVHCFGCGALNEHGLQIKSFWEGDDVVCDWQPKPHHIGYPGILYGGMIASIVDCHAMWTASAHAYRLAGVEMEGTIRYPFVTASLKVDYRRPVPIDRRLKLRARVTRFDERKATVACQVLCDGAISAEAEVLAVRVPAAAPPA